VRSAATEDTSGGSPSSGCATDRRSPLTDNGWYARIGVRQNADMVMGKRFQACLCLLPVCRAAKGRTWMVLSLAFGAVVRPRPFGPPLPASVSLPLTGEGRDAEGA